MRIIYLPIHCFQLCNIPSPRENLTSIDTCQTFPSQQKLGFQQRSFKKCYIIRFSRFHFTRIRRASVSPYMVSLVAPEVQIHHACLLGLLTGRCLWSRLLYSPGSYTSRNLVSICAHEHSVRRIDMEPSLQEERYLLRWFPVSTTPVARTCRDLLFNPESVAGISGWGSPCNKENEHPCNISWLDMQVNT